MDGVNPDTVWTWNAIGKRAGAWNLAPDAPEATRGFLLNHMISELLPPGERSALRQRRSGDRPGGVVRSARPHRKRGAGRRRRRARRHCRRCACPHGLRRRRPPALRRAVRRRKAAAMTSLPAAPRRRRSSASSSISTSASAVTPAPSRARSGTPAATPRRSPISMPYGAEPDGVWFNRVHTFEVGEGADGTHRPFPALLPALRRRRPASRCARPAPPSSAPRTASCWSTRISASAASCAPGPAPTARANTTTMPAS